jgi:ketosteroid isomerase-like protein
VSAEDIKVVRQGLDAINRGDLDAFAACLHPEVEWDDTEGGPGFRKVHHGRAAMREWLRESLEPWESVHTEAEEITQVSEGRVLVGTLTRGRGRASGVEQSSAFGRSSGFWTAR